MSLRAAVLFDVEGPVSNPGVDFAYVMLDLITDVRDKYFDRVREFDEYDDLRWMWERDRGGSYSTGTTPFITLVLAAIGGLSDRDLVSLAQELSKICVNRGIPELLKSLSDLGADVYLISSAYPAYPLSIACRLGIPLDRVYTMGYRGVAVNDVYSETIRRSPLGVLARYRGALAELVDNIFDLARSIRDDIMAGRDPRRDVQRLYSLIKSVRHDDLRETLIRHLVDQSSLMGSRMKADVVRMLRGAYDCVIYVGDSIVDADAMEVSDISISVNCVSPHVLIRSDLCVITEDMRGLAEVIRLSLVGRKISDRAELVNAIVLSRDYVAKNTNLALKLCREARERLAREIVEHVRGCVSKVRLSPISSRT